MFGLYLPAGHWVHPTCPESELNEPDAHGRHEEEEFAPAKLPNVPAGHDVQLAWPVLGLKVPGGHATQAARSRAPTEALNVPIGQGWQLAWETEPFIALNVPMGHCIHDCPKFGLYVPGEQSEQLALGGVVLVVPAGQARQSLGEEDNAVGLYVPGGQTVHRCVTGELYMPSRHETQEAFDVAPTIALEVPRGQNVQLSTDVAPLWE